jgi:hypothetical protein
VIGLAHLGRREDLAALRPLTEELVETGAWTYSLLSPFHTAAGITAAATGDWAAAEKHHTTAIHQTDVAPYRHLQPVSREWYARMLLDRRGPSDEIKAAAIVDDAIAMYQSIGLPARAMRAREVRATL